MKEIKNTITPLVITGLFVLFTGVYVFLQDSGEEGWGYLVGIIITLFSIPVFMMNFIMQILIKNRRINLVFQLPIAIVILIIYWKWELIFF
ncbi:hypothetical protein [uncultured Aquimarina sp.]|uniref:hypothetical protein n=1 Tax=uncultured Aquimarina sp. TaxID=575652 RepID=UPI002628B239|nr:hypothetical protein [uncultured Aquimarina sp.]